MIKAVEENKLSSVIVKDVSRLAEIILSESAKKYLKKHLGDSKILNVSERK